MKVLNLYAGIGGNRKLWPADYQVTAVELDADIAAVYSRLYPDDEVIVGDAHQYLEKHFLKFDFLWSSPPCQSHSRMAISGQNRTPKFADLSLYEEIILLQTYCKTPWVIENVKPYYAPLIPGSARGRHLFWSNFNIPTFSVPDVPDFINTTLAGGKDRLMDWLGIHFEENIYYGNSHCPAQILRNAVHPVIGLSVLQAAFGLPVTASATQMELL